MKVSILQGVYADAAANFVTSYPINMRPILGDNGLSDGNLRTEPGLAPYAVTPGADRGAVIWNGVSYRVSGTKLISIAPGGAVTVLGDVGSGGEVSFDYSFDRVAVTSGGRLYYWDGATLTQVTDIDLGTALDVIWIDGYFMTTDGTYLVVTDLADPFSVNPLKYGSSDVEPDPVVALKKVRNEVYAVNRYTIENFQNVGGSGFPFARNVGGLIMKGATGTKAVDNFEDTLAFVGGGVNEGTSVYIAGYGETTNISTPQIDNVLSKLTPTEQAAIVVETVKDQGEARFLIHLPAQALVYHHLASLKSGQRVWTSLRGGANIDQPYPCRHFIFAEGRFFLGGGSGFAAYLNDTIETQNGATVGWQFDTAFLYNEGRGGILKSAELMGLAGHAPGGVTPTVFMSWTQDGMTWSQERAISTGALGKYLKRMQWRPKTKFSNYMGLRFRAANTALQAFARLEVEVEPLNG